MIQSIDRSTLVEMLLNSLAAERYIRRPLLVEIIGELSTSSRFHPARRSARALLERLDRGDLSDAELSLAIQDVRSKLSRRRRSTGRARASGGDFSGL